MSETKRCAPFWREFPIWLLGTLGMLILFISALMGELSLFFLGFAMLVILTPGALWCGIKEYESRLGKKGILGFLLFYVCNFMILGALDSMNAWNWVKLCLVLLGAGLILYDIASKRDLSVADSEAREIASKTYTDAP